MEQVARNIREASKVKWVWVLKAQEIALEKCIKPI